MTGKLYIDGLDAFVSYGVFVQDGGYAELVQWPALKKVDSNDWPEDDGIDADLSNPRLESKEFQMSFCCVDQAKTIFLFDHLTDGAYHTFNFTEIGVEKELRLVSQPSTNTIMPLQIFSLRFADDDYLNSYEREDPVSIPSCTQRNYQIDTIDFSDYGVWVLSGTLDSIIKAPAVKKNLSISVESNDGAIYEDSAVRFQSKDVSFKCLLKAHDIHVFWRNFRAFLYDLIQPAERMLHIADSNEYFSCYYKSSKVSKFAKIPDGSIWCEFNMTLCFVSARPGQIEYLLSSEGGELIVTEDSGDDYKCFIDMVDYEN